MGSASTVVLPSTVTVCPTVAVIEPVMIYARPDSSTPLVVVVMYVGTKPGAARNVGVPFKVTLWPIKAVEEPLMI